MSINAEKIVGPEGRVISFEPDSSILPLLKRNKQINNSGLTIVEKAVTDHQGVERFHIATESGLSRLSNAHQNLFGLELLQHSDVPADTLDSVLCQIIPDRAVNLIKVDVEGHELRVLRGAVNTLKTCRPVLFLEINHGALKENDVVFKDIVDFLTPFEYGFYRVNSHAADWFRLGRMPTFTPINNQFERFMSMPFDLLCVPPGRSIPPRSLEAS